MNLGHEHLRLLGEKFGPTGHNHKELMPLLWGPAANFAIFLALYSYRTIWSWIHGAFFSLATIVALSTSLPILFHTGFIQENTTLVTKYSIWGLRVHYWVGFVSLFSMVLAVTLGISTKLINIMEKKSSLLLLIRKFHKICGYLTTILCKLNIYVITWGEDFAGYLICDLIFVFLLIYWKMKFPRMESRQMNLKPLTIPKSVSSIKELNQGKDYLVFSNLVYEMQPLTVSHPAGFQIMKSVKNKEIDRYIYGSYTVDFMQNISLWSHSYKSFTLLAQPVAKIDIPSTFQGFELQQVQCQIFGLKQISERGEIFVANIIKKQGSPFRYTGLTNVKQLGRYFSLRCGQRNTRLYSTINFLVEQNLQFLSKYLRYPEFVSEERILAMESQLEFQSRRELQKNLRQKIIEKTTSINDFREIELWSIDEDISNKRRNSIPIIFKVYPGGKLTTQILRSSSKTISLSCPKGQGLRLSNTKPGRILIVAGGTGLLPFSDLIDLLFKQQLMKMNPSSKEQVLRLNPILEDDPFACYEFQMLAAFNKVEQIHHITFQQLIFLTERGRLKITFKFKEKIKDKVEGENISFTNRRFQHLLDDVLSQQTDLSKIWICGPPKMNQSLAAFLKNSRLSPDLYHFI